jgi:hypothetical protein
VVYKIKDTSLDGSGAMVAKDHPDAPVGTASTVKMVTTADLYRLTPEELAGLQVISVPDGSSTAILRVASIQVVPGISATVTIPDGRVFIISDGGLEEESRGSSDGQNGTRRLLSDRRRLCEWNAMLANLAYLINAEHHSAKLMPTSVLTIYFPSMFTLRLMLFHLTFACRSANRRDVSDQHNDQHIVLWVHVLGSICATVRAKQDHSYQCRAQLQLRGCCCRPCDRRQYQWRLGFQKCHAHVWSRGHQRPMVVCQ